MWGQGCSREKEVAASATGGRGVGRLTHRKRCPVSRFWPQQDRSPWELDRDLSAPYFQAHIPLLSPMPSKAHCGPRLHPEGSER